MASFYLWMYNEREFYERMKNRDFELVNKMTKSVISAAQRNLKKIDIFEITFENKSTLTFSIESKDYKNLLENCLKDFIKVEDYETCAKLKKIIDKLKS